MSYPLKEETIIKILNVLLKIGRSSAFEFANEYWLDKKVSGRTSSQNGINLLFKVKKFGYLNVYKRPTTTKPQGIFVFEVSEEGHKFLEEASNDNA